MAFRLIRDDSRRYLDPTPEATGGRAEAQRAVEILGADYLRWSRVGLGLLGFVGTVIGASGFGLIADAIAGGHPAVITAFAATMGTALLAVLAASLWLLIRLATSGSRLVRALAAWLAGPYRSGQLASSWAGWLHTRLLLFRPGVFVRIAAASCAALFGAYATYAFLSTFAAPSPALLAPGLLMYGCWAATAFTVSVVLFAGSIRLVNGRAQADRVWRSVRDGAIR